MNIKELKEKNGWLSAKEAKEYVKILEQKNAENVINEIMQRIKNAAEKGTTGIVVDLNLVHSCFNDNLLNICTEILEELGYTISGSATNSVLIINWYKGD